MAAITQKSIVLEHLMMHGSISSIEAIEKYKITRLADVIYRLKKKGYGINSADIPFVNALTGNPGTFAKYTLISTPDGTK